MASAQVPLITLSPEFKAEIREQHGRRASNRVNRWEKLLAEGPAEDISSTLRQVNRFFNRIRHREDERIWHQDDYWATPVEMLIKNAGDCEDYTIGKYFTLRAWGIPDAALRLIYVSRTGEQEPHMVLTYFDDSLEEPVVLDNLMRDIKPVSERTDLQAVYSFNGKNLWLSENLSEGSLLGSPTSLEHWTSMLNRLP